MNTVCCQCIGIPYIRCACVAYQRIRTRTNGSSSSNSSRSSSSTFCIGMFTLTVCVYMNSITCQTIHICCMRTKVIHKQKKKETRKTTDANCCCCCCCLQLYPDQPGMPMYMYNNTQKDEIQLKSTHQPTHTQYPRAANGYIYIYIYVHKRCYRCMWNWLIC